MLTSNTRLGTRWFARAADAAPAEENVEETAMAEKPAEETEAVAEEAAPVELASGGQ